MAPTVPEESVVRRVGLALSVVLAVVGLWLWSRRRRGTAAIAEGAAANTTAVAIAVPVVTRTESRSRMVVPVAGTPPTPADISAPTTGPDEPAVLPQAVKVKTSSGLYHTPSSPSWARMHADAWFESEAAAEAAGFRRWDWRRGRS
jgi:hypothetical protein